MTAVSAGRRRPGRPARVVLHLFLGTVAVGWLFPILWAVLTSFRSYEYTAANGYVSLGGWTVDNYVTAWRTAEFGKHFLNSAYITVPAVLLTLFLASCVAFVIARFSWKLNIALLGLFTAANLLPQQALLIPLFRMFTEIPLPAWMSDSELLYDSYWGLILVNVAFQCGFCVFVLSNYMKALPHELYEAAMVDGATRTQAFLKVALPAARPAIAVTALFAFMSAWNEFILAATLLGRESAFTLPVVLQSYVGEYSTQWGAFAAGAVLVSVPVIVLFYVAQRQLLSGLTAGGVKG